MLGIKLEELESLLKNPKRAVQKWEDNEDLVNLMMIFGLAATSLEFPVQF